jgi:hypothetical protein
MEIIARAEKYLLVDGQKQDIIFDKLNSLAVEKRKRTGKNQKKAGGSGRKI